MAIDRDAALAMVFEPLHVDIERGRLRRFAAAIGETSPVYTDVEAARAAGHPDLPVPPTFYFSLGLEAPDPFAYLAELGVPLGRVLHGEQGFHYTRMAYAGDTLTLTERIVDVQAKRGGALELITRSMTITRGAEPIAVATGIVVVRHPETETRVAS